MSWGSPPGRPTREVQRLLLGRRPHSVEVLGSTFHLLDSRWWRNWQRWVSTTAPQTDGSEQRDVHPGTISNETLLQDGNGELRPGLRAEHDYVLVAAECFEQLMQWYGGGPSIARVVTQSGSGELTVDVYPVQRATPSGADAATAARGGATHDTAGPTRRIVTRKGRALLAPPSPPHQQQQEQEQEQEQEQASEQESEWGTCSGEGTQRSEDDSHDDSEGEYDSYGSDASYQCAACVQAARAARATPDCNCDYCMGHEDEEDSLPELEDDSEADSITALMSDDDDEAVPPPPPPPAGDFEGGFTAAFGNLLGLRGMGGVFPIAFGIGGVSMDGGEQPPPAVMDALFRTLGQPPPRRAESNSPAATTTAASAAARRSTAAASANRCNVPTCPCRGGAATAAAAAADDDDDLTALLSDDEAAPTSVPGPDRDCRFYVSLYRRTAATAVAAAAASSCAVAARDTQFLVEAVGELGVDVHSMQVQATLKILEEACAGLPDASTTTPPPPRCDVNLTAVTGSDAAAGHTGGH